MVTSPYRNPLQNFSQPNLGVFAGKVYAWMTLMLLVTAGVSFASIQLGAYAWMIHHPYIFLALLLGEIVLVGMFDGMRTTLSFPKGLFLVGAYTVLNGLTLSVGLSQYHISSVGIAFLASSLIFGLATLYGFIGRGLARLREWLFMGLMALLVALTANLLLGSQLIDYILSALTVVLFTGLAAYDAQVIELRAARRPTNLDALDCALEVYLDFLNIFLAILRLLAGKNKDD